MRESPRARGSSFRVSVCVPAGKSALISFEPLTAPAAVFAAVFAHAVLSGTDFAAPVIGWLGWAAAASVGVLVLQRVNTVSRSA